MAQGPPSLVVYMDPDLRTLWGLCRSEIAGSVYSNTFNQRLVAYAPLALRFTPTSEVTGESCFTLANGLQRQPISWAIEDPVLTG